ncbi:hypothetical protein KO505_09230 [Psychrosphaera sp. F3M07]|nr:hypothetical protein [Psychrosphaera sp. F3M07]
MHESHTLKINRVIKQSATNTLTTSCGWFIGELDSNLYKGSAIILSIVYVQWQIKNGKPREVNLNNLWSKKPLLN